jgi:transcription antitermination factor NusG
MWIVARTETRGEDRAAWHVRMRGEAEDVYLPRLRELIVVDGQRALRESFLYPGYLFILIVDQWHWLLETFGILTVIRESGGDNPAIIPETSLARIRSLEDRDGYVCLPKKPRFSKSQRVRIEQGLFEGRTGLYDIPESLERDRVLIHILGRQVPVSVSVGSLVSA